MRSRKTPDPFIGGRSTNLEKMRREFLRLQRTLERRDEEIDRLRAQARHSDHEPGRPVVEPTVAPSPTVSAAAQGHPQALRARRWGSVLRAAVAISGRLGMDWGLPTPFVAGAPQRLTFGRYVQGHLDEPAGATVELAPGEPLVISGWLLGRHVRVARVGVTWGERWERTIDYHLVRPDVVRALGGAPEADRSGFWGELPTHGMAGATEVRCLVWAELEDGERVDALPFCVHLRAADIPASSVGELRSLLCEVLSHFGEARGHEELVFTRLIEEWRARGRSDEQLAVDLRQILAPPVRPPRVAAPTRERLRVLLITGFFPSFEHGGGLTMFDVSSQLAERHEVDLYSTYRPHVDGTAMPLLRAKLRALHLTTGQLELDELRAWLASQGRDVSSYDVIHFFCAGSIPLIEGLAGFAPRRIFSMQESMSRRSAIDLQRALAERSGHVGRAACEIVENLLHERIALQNCDHAIAYVEEDADFAQSLLSARPDVIPIGVSEHALLQTLRTRAGDRDAAIVPHAVTFLGYYDHSPNIDSMLWYLHQVHPRVLAQVPDYRMFVVGNGETTPLTSRFGGDPSIVFVGHVDDIAVPLLHAQVCIAPLVSGAGFRGKINQYAAAGRPSVATTLANNSLPYRHGESILIADSAEAFAAETVSLLTDQARWLEIRRAAEQVCETHFRWPTLIGRYDQLYRR